MKTRILVLALAIALAAIALTSCTDTKYITNEEPGDTVQIQGTVYAWRCGLHDWFNNDPDPEKSRFSVDTGEPATVTFIRDNGFVSTVETDDSSNFSLYLSPGSHNIIVETGYSFPPDTFYNILLTPGDTTLNLDIMYRVLDPLNIEFVFGYPTLSDTASTLEEWNVIHELNQRTYDYGRYGYPAIDLKDLTQFASKRQIHQSGYTTKVFTVYDLPIHRFSNGNRELFNVVEVDDLLQDLIARDTTSLIPDVFGAYAAGTYLCLH